LYWRAMMASPDTTLAAIAAKAEKEITYHVRHSAEWVVRLGDGTPESRARMQAALAALWPFTGEIFAVDEIDRAVIAEGTGTDPETLRAPWREAVARVLNQAELAVPADGWMQMGGRTGRHSEHIGHLLAELQYVQRAIPGARW
jgi:ring-1,2-phenylacetyl-CoA epoxidase subunit PaaC